MEFRIPNYAGKELKYSRTINDVDDCKFEINLAADKAKLQECIKQLTPLKSNFPFLKSVMASFEPFGSVKYTMSDKYNTPNISSEWLKSYEIMAKYKLFDDTKEMQTHLDIGNVLGAFMQGCYHYIATNTIVDLKTWNWFVSSPTDFENFDDLYDLKNKYQNRILPFEGIQHIISEVDLLTIEYEDDNNDFTSINREEMHKKHVLYYSMLALRIIKAGGNLVLKLYDFSSPFTVSIIAILSECFGQLFLYKPVCSKLDNGEIFLVGKSLCPAMARVHYQHLLDFYKHYDVNFKLEDYVISGPFSPEFREAISRAVKEFFYKIVDKISHNIDDFHILARRNGNDEYQIKTFAKRKYIAYNDEIRNKWYQKFNMKPMKSEDKLWVYNTTVYRGR